MVQCLPIMRLLHLSDLHLSRYGESGTWTRRDPADDERWKPVRVWQRWQIEGCRDRKGRPDKLRLVDPEGLIHKVKSWPRRDEKLVAQLLGRAMRRHQTSTERLVSDRPPRDELDALLGADPRNTNLRFMRIVDDVVALQPEVIAITGDLTNNGFGYELVRHYLAPWIDRGRLFTVPGNHDAYDMLPRLGRSARAAHKVDCYREFAESIGLASNPTGAYVRRVDDIAVVGLDSCKMPRTPLSASGAVSREQLVWLRELGHDAAFAGARLRVGLVHHHLLRMPFQLGRRTPLEMGMRLRNAVEVMEVCTDARMDLLLNGHRHHGYVVQLPGRPMVISAPSSTAGCKTTRQTYAWLINLADRYPFPVVLPLNGRPP
jgi:3',5'-cyclic AMP phosphodiesterase CpdA